MKISKMNNNTFAEPVDTDFFNLSCDIFDFDWSPSIFHSNYRTKANFISTELLVLDVDEGLSFDDAEKAFAKYKYIIATTKSHQVEKNGITCDRYRVILFLEAPITDSATYEATWQSIYNEFPFIDKACKDSSRFFYKCIGIRSYKEKGDLVKIVSAQPRKYDNTVHDMKGFYPSSYLYAKNWGLAKGGRNNAIFRISCELFRCGYNEDEVFNLILAITDLPEHEISNTVQSSAKAVLK